LVAKRNGERLQGRFGGGNSPRSVVKALIDGRVLHDIRRKEETGQIQQGFHEKKERLSAGGGERKVREEKLMEGGKREKRLKKGKA